MDAGSSQKLNLWLVCFKYAPGNWQHMESFAGRAEENGFSIRFILSKHFSWMTDSFSNMTLYITQSANFTSILLDTVLFLLYRWLILWRLLRKDRPGVIVLVMWHPLNAVFCFLAKLAAGSRIVAWLHEPYKQDKLIYGSKAIIFYLVEWLQTLSMPWIDDVIVHSEFAFQAFQKRYPNFKKPVHIIPLQFRDQPGQKRNRQYVSFLGKAAKAKGIEKFFELVQISTLRGLQWKFAIATSDDLTGHLAKLSPSARENLEVFYEPNLSDTTLREIASHSLVALCLYTSSLQSGVVPLSFMCGTPVVASNIKPLRVSVEHRKTGYFVSLPIQMDEVFEALIYIKNNFSSISENCRQKFLDIYDDRNWKTSYGQLFKKDNTNSEIVFTYVD